MPPPACVTVELGAVEVGAAGGRGLVGGRAVCPHHPAMRCRGAVPLALGLALAQRMRRVLVATGDAELLMGMGSLATVAVQAPDNLCIAVFDNERYGETGMQATATAHTADLAAIAQACGIPVTGTVRDDAELTAAMPKMLTQPGPCVFVIKVRAEPLPFILPPKDGAYLKDRFRLALLGEAGIV